MKKSARIIFMGTAAFAVPTLDKLSNCGYDIVAVVTAPDKPAGRGKKIRYSPVKEYALEHKLRILQPENLRESSFIGTLADLKPDLQVVVAFRMLPEAVWKIPPKGTINLHASLLPQFRGAAPINHAIMRGSLKTGVTTFFVDDKIDTGKILKQTETTIGSSETAGELHDRLMELGAELILSTVQDLISGSVNPVAQNQLIEGVADLSPAPKIFKEDCRIDWNQEIKTVYNFIRGLSPIPGAYTSLHFTDGSQKLLKVYRAEMIQESFVSAPGTLRIGINTIEVGCKNGYLFLLEVQLEGKRKMHTEEFLRGINLKTIKRIGLL